MHSVLVGISSVVVKYIDIRANIETQLTNTSILLNNPANIIWSSFSKNNCYV